MSTPRVTPLGIGLLGFSAVAHGGLLASYLTGGVSRTLIDLVTILVLTAISFSLSVLKPLVRTKWAYAVVVGLHVAVSAGILSLHVRYGVEPVAWTAIILAESVVYLPALTGGIVAALFIASHVLMTGVIPEAAAGVSHSSFLLRVLLLVFVGIGAIIFATYREELVRRERDVERLDSAVLRLSRANTSYQQFALDVEARSTELERQRITRDIHDIVGYALTNSIVTMEAAVDMIRVDPLRVPALLQSARDNAEEGLSRIRESLYRLRSRETQHPKGIAGISRMVNHFKEATGIEVHLEVGGVPPIFLGETVGHVVHHFVQEAIINSFRHARADRILVMLFWSDDRFIASVWDDGPGVSDSASEGIGITGMRERAETVRGAVAYERVIDGFTISLTIPREEMA